METIKLYEHDPYLRRFDATVLRCVPQGKAWHVTLDRTAFYPEGGGQGADHGTLGGAQVSDVQERGGVIVHTCDRALQEGAAVTGELDWQRRFDHMQQHSGEHIVSGMLCAAYHCDNVGFHMGADTVTIDYNADIPWEGVLAIERQANRYIWEDHPVRITYPAKEELAALPYRSKKALEGQVRITEFPGADMCACCGTHVASSAQVGLVKFIGWQKFRGGVRLEVLFGQRAMDCLSASWQQNTAIGRELSVKPEATHAAVLRLKEELAALKQRCGDMETEHFAALAERYAGAGDVALLCPAMEPDAVRRLCDAVAQRCGGRCAVFAGNEGAYKYAVIQPGADIRAFIKDMNAALHGRGGGRDGFAQGSAACTAEEIKAFFGGLNE